MNNFDFDNHWYFRNEIIDQLEEDANYNYEEYIKLKSQVHLRNYIRSLFSLYEGILANLREKLTQKIILMNFLGETKNINIYELYVLMDESVSINDRGGLNKKFNANSFTNLLKFVLTKVCEINKIEEKIFDQGWNDFKSFVKIRDRITHPKYDKGVFVSDEDVLIIENARKWWNTAIRKVFN